MQVIIINNGQQEVINTLKAKKKTSVIPDAIFLALMDMPNYSGFNWKQYIEATIQYNTQQIYKQAIIDLQQQKELEINSSEYQNIIDNQIRQKVNINNDKISGAVDLQLIGLNNLAKVEGIKSFDDNAKVRFIAITDENSTDMCQSMNNMEFYIDKENEFDRYWGETKKELKLVRIKVKGLVPGINLAPVMHHWHWCRSTITYQSNISREKLDKMMNREYIDITNKILNADKKEYTIEEQQYFIDDNNVKYKIDRKNVKIKATKKEREVAKILGEIYGGRVKLVPVVLNPKGIKTPDYIVKGKKFDLKEPEGSSPTTIYDLFKHKSKQADNFIIDMHKSKLERLNAIEQTEELFHSKHRKWINTVILMENNEIFKVFKRKQ